AAEAPPTPADRADRASAPPEPRPSPATESAPPPPEAPPQPEGPAPIPWEHAGERNEAEAFVHTVREALLGPQRFMGRVPWIREDLRAPLLFAVLAGGLGHLGLVIQTMFLPAEALSNMQLPALPGVSPVALLLLTMPFVPLLVTGLLFFESTAAHVLLRLIGAAPRPFEATFRVFAYAEVASLLLLVPIVGPYAQKFYVVFLLLTGLRLAQGAGLPASLIALVPVVLRQMVQM
ncbi:MAG: hypothetical protein KC620_20385, partial [Myxococcales bacterium]|nr:hypothetical protein [Myxococcales bacterium]